MIIEIFDVFEKYGYHRGDDTHAGRAMHMLAGAAATYQEGP